MEDRHVVNDDLIPCFAPVYELDHERSVDGPGDGSQRSRRKDAASLDGAPYVVGRVVCDDLVDRRLDACDRSLKAPITIVGIAPAHPHTIAGVAPSRQGDVS